MQTHIVSEKQSDLIRHIYWSPGGEHILTVSQERTNGPLFVELHDLQNPRVTNRYSVDGMLSSCAWAPGGEQFAIAAFSGKVSIHSTKSRQADSALGLPKAGQLLAIDWNRQQAWIAGGAFTEQGHPFVVVWSATDGKVQSEVELRDVPGGTIPWIGWSPDGQRLGVIFSLQMTSSFDQIDNKLFIFRCDSEGKLQQDGDSIQLPNGFVSSNRGVDGWSPEGRYVAVALHGQSGNGAIVLVDLEQRTIAKTWQHPDKKKIIKCAVFARSNQLIATTDGERVMLLSAASANLVSAFEINSFLPAGGRFSTSGQDSQGRWSLSIGGFTNSVDFSTDGSLMAVGNNGSLRIFAIRS